MSKSFLARTILPSMRVMYFLIKCIFHKIGFHNFGVQSAKLINNLTNGTMWKFGYANQFCEIKLNKTRFFDLEYYKEQRELKSNSLKYFRS